MNEEYKPNSHKFKEKQEAELSERKKLDKVVKGKVTTIPRSKSSKIADIFISEDIANVKSYILMDVLVPAVKKAISDIVREGIDMILYGGSGRGKSTVNASYVQYTSYSDKDNRSSGYVSNPSSRYDLDDIVFEHRREAEEVIARMDELIDVYKVVSVADLYDLIGKTCDYTGNKYGWTNIRNAEPVRVRNGYALKLPKPLPIK